MLYLNWRFTLIALSVAPVLFLVVYSYTRRIKKASREVRKKEGEIVSVIEEVLSSIRVVKAFAREDYEQRRLEEESLESVEIGLRARGLKAKLSPLVDIIVAVGTCLVLWFGARMVFSGALSPGSLVVFILYLGKMYKPMQELSKMTDTYSKALVGYERIREVLETDKRGQGSSGAQSRPHDSRGRSNSSMSTFTTTPRQPDSQGRKPYHRSGTVGRSRRADRSRQNDDHQSDSALLRPDLGIDQDRWHRCKAFQQKSLRQQISFVLQETVLFHGPVWQNIAYGKPGASRAEILSAAEHGQCPRIYREAARMDTTRLSGSEA